MPVPTVKATYDSLLKVDRDGLSCPKPDPQLFLALAGSGVSIGVAL